MSDGIDHLAIAVTDLASSLPFYQETLGLELLGIEEVPSQRVRVALLQAGAIRIELLEPTSEDSPISKFLATRGPGLHHVAFHTADVASRLAELKTQGIRLIDEAPRLGAESREVAFLHPKSAGGVLIEFCGEIGSQGAP